MASVTKNGRGIRDEVKAKERELQFAIKQSRRRCDHKRNGDGAQVVRVHDPNLNIYIRDKHKMSNDTVVCKECHEIFELRSYTREEVEGSVNMLRSMINQIKVLANLNDDELDEIVDLLEWFDMKIEGSLVPYYEGMMKKLSGGGDGKRRNDTHQKGRVGNISGSHMGVSSRSFR